MAWLGVHASFMTGIRDKVEAIIDWNRDRFSKAGGPHVLDLVTPPRSDCDDDPTTSPSGEQRETEPAS